MIYATEQQVVVTSAIVLIVGLFAFTIGMWVGHGKRDEAEEAELDRAIERHPAGKGRHRQDADMPGVLLELPPHDPTLGGKLHDIHGGPGEDCWCGYVGHDLPERVGAYGPFPVSDEEYLLLTSPLLPAEFEGKTMVMCECTQVPEMGPCQHNAPPGSDDLSWTGEIAKMTAAFQRDMDGLIGGTDEKLREITR